MKQIGQYNFNGNSTCCFLPLSFNADLQTNHPDYFIQRPCDKHNGCVFTSIRGVPLHGKELGVQTIIFDENYFTVDEHPLFFNYEHPPSKNNAPFCELETIELMNIINTPIKCPSKRHSMN
ncbi:hypothetical protein EDI_097060 [Entamoeba dispar SAW760]|uniref:Uncharacterized protein n=1 Tax=Entamoeba dispar (strain ATCC PRA-260 / SAW760) TaxID=370354 RepID=B0EBD2_ENTDS|nr:uncharacterized protein EDI_097060 [Entamoeba dispar SAW760]EDR28183.1 hypothetical protein EDI_097060 [Entamoeba dispar SAW760]|eukprot:EDR28183.1 hypothetical protein EDI_097060 [Entamoeba dispar SAW760]